FNMERMSHQSLLFEEIALGFGMPVLNRGQHFLKVGGTVKLLLGVTGSYLYTNELHAQFDTTGLNNPNVTKADIYRVNTGGRLDYGYSANFPFSKDVKGNFGIFDFTALPSVAFDFGAVY